MRKTPILAAMLTAALLLGALASPAQAQIFGRGYRSAYYAPSYYSTWGYAPSYYAPSIGTAYGATTSYYPPYAGAQSYYYNSYPSYYYGRGYNYRRPLLGYRRAYRYGYGY